VAASLQGHHPGTAQPDALMMIIDESFLVLFFKKEPLARVKRKQALLFEKRSKNFL
jgi:hypothetical protein